MATATTKIASSGVSIKTAPVEVKVKILTVNRKAMTLAMFRQLPEEEIIDTETGDFRGTPWGRVNYHPECRSKKHHVHVVWEDEGVLKHACEYDTPPEHRLYGSLEEWLGAAVLAGIFREGWDVPEVKKVVASVKGGLLYGINLGLPKEFHAYYDAKKQIDNQGIDLHEHIDELRARSEVRVDALAWPEATGTEILTKHVEPLTNTIREFEAKWRAQYKALEQLDQLFIAV